MVLFTAKAVLWAIWSNNLRLHQEGKNDPFLLRPLKYNRLIHKNIELHQDWWNIFHCCIQMKFYRMSASTLVSQEQEYESALIMYRTNFVVGWSTSFFCFRVGTLPASGTINNGSVHWLNTWANCIKKKYISTTNVKCFPPSYRNLQWSVSIETCYIGGQNALQNKQQANSIATFTMLMH